MTAKQKNIIQLVVNRMKGNAPGMTKDEAAKQLKIGRRTVDTVLLKLLVELHYGK